MSNDGDIWSQLVAEAREADRDDREAGTDVDQGRLLLARLLAFRRYNRARLDRLRRGLDSETRAVFDLLPLLVHQPVNGAPGGDDPHRGGYGIVNFEANQHMQHALERFFPQAPWRPGALLGRPVIHSLLAMGSMGTLAQTSRSDLDLWVIFDEGIMGTDQHERLQERLGQVERWADERGLEVHFFPLTAGQVRRADFGSVGPESAGSALRQMLKEEFYRTHLLLQGRVPLWWLAEAGANREDCLRVGEQLLREANLNGDDFIDLGNPEPVVPGEYLGACLWQIVKSLRRPFKSLLKLTLLERALRWPESTLLCEELKARVQEGADDDSLAADPYFIMVDTVVGDFERGGLPDTANLLKTCFYLQLLAGRAPAGAEILRRQLLSRLAESWGWSAAEQVRLDGYLRWPLADVVAVGRRIESYMDTILDGLRQQLGSSQADALDPRDMRLLERKIRTSRSMHHRQVPLLPVAYYPGNLEQAQLRVRESETGWWIAVGNSEGPVAGPLESIDLTAMCAVVNGWFGPATAVSVEGGQVTSAGLRRRMERMARLFSGARPELVPIDHFAAEACPQAVLLEVRAEGRPQSDVPGTTRLSEQWDLLDYGRQHLCLLDEVLVWTLTTWGTVVHRRYRGSAGLPRLLLELLQQLHGNGYLHLEAVPGDGTAESLAMSKRLQVTLEAAGNGLLAADGQETALLTTIADYNWMLLRRDEEFRLVGPLDARATSDLLAEGGRRLVVDPGSVRWSVLRWALERHRVGCEEVFLFRDEEIAAVVCGAEGQILLLEGMPEAASRLIEQVGGREALKACYLRTDTGRFSECGLPVARMEKADLIAEVVEPERIRLWVTGMERPARSLDQAATWLLSLWRPGAERSPRLRLRHPVGCSWDMSLAERLRLHAQLLERIEKRCRQALPGGRRKSPGRGINNGRGDPM